MRQADVSCCGRQNSRYSRTTFHYWRADAHSTLGHRCDRTIAFRALHPRGAELDVLRCGVRGGCPAPGNNLHKCQEWLRGANKDAPDTALERFGGVIAEYMDAELAQARPWAPHPNDELDPRARIQAALAKEGLRYQRGGHIMGAALTGPSRSLGDRLKEEGQEAIELEYRRAYDQVEAAPPAAVTAACAILESVCKTYLESEGHALPSKQVLGSLWTGTAARLGLAAKDVADGDLRQILSGLSSIAVGVAALRTHKGSVHGHTDAAKREYRLEPRHARLAVHAVHTLAMFVLETWEARTAGRP